MRNSNKLKLNTLFACSALVISGNALAAETNLFEMTSSAHVLQLAEGGSKCGGKTMPEEAKCGGKEKPAEGKCGGSKPKPKEGKCGEGKCGSK